MFAVTLVGRRSRWSHRGFSYCASTPRHIHTGPDPAKDLRSDTVTQPSPSMRNIMRNAPVGDDIFGEDPSVNALESYIAHLTGHEAALFCASGTMSNQLAIRTHLTDPPYSVLCDARSHVHQWETSGISFHCGAAVHPINTSLHKPLKFSALSSQSECKSLCTPQKHHLTADLVQQNLLLDSDVHIAPTKLVILENSLEGEILPFCDCEEIARLCKLYRLKLHVDGARLWNTSVATGIPLKEWSILADSVSLCLSKGLGAPVGSVLSGSRSFIRKARHYRKLFGGGWRQAGMLAAAGLHAMEGWEEKLQKDHLNAITLAAGLHDAGCEIVRQVDTNMVWAKLPFINGMKEHRSSLTMSVLADDLRAHGIAISGGDATVGRFVLHHQITAAAISEIINVIKMCIAKRKSVLV